MKSEKPTLVVGGTGRLGVELVALLARRGASVRVLTRGSLEGEPAPGVEWVKGDLRDRASLEAACRGVGCVVLAATALRSRHAGDSIATVDRAGQLALIEIAERAGAERFVLLSFPPLEGEPQRVDFALQRAKRDVEARLVSGATPFVVLQPAHFMEVWLSPAVGFDPWQGRIRLLGGGTRAVSWISLRDVAAVVAAAHGGLLPERHTLALGGPEALSPREVAAVFESCGYPPSELTDEPEEKIASRLALASDARDEARAAMALVTARGLVVPPVPAFVGIREPVTVRDFALAMSNHNQ